MTNDECGKAPKDVSGSPAGISGGRRLRKAVMRFGSHTSEASGCSTMRGLSLRVGIVIMATVALAGVVWVIWGNEAQEQAVHSKVLTEARTLNKQMQAVWDYVDDAQLSINTDSDGSFDFKNVYCSVAGKGIARRFTQNADGYVIRYVRENPRSGTDEPDAFEQRALECFAAGDDDEFYEMAQVDGEPVFRYASMLTVRNNCLDCHGGPAGEKDITGFLKEGMELGDVAGAVSMIIPVGVYQLEAVEEKTRSLVFFVALALVIALVVSIALRKWVAAPMQHANERLASENKVKSDFLAMMSHELRTPLASIIAFTDIWEKSGNADALEEARLVREIKENSSALLNMVNNTLDAARLEAGSFTVELGDVDLVDVLGAVFAVAEPLAVKGGVALERRIDPDIPVMRTDGEALRKILVNLVGNALKFTAPGGRVQVDALLAKDGSKVILLVADDGPGVASEARERIFEKFSQAPSSTVPEGAAVAKAGGSGLGLYVVRSLAERLGGTVEVLDCSDTSPLAGLSGRISCVGALFVVTLPVDSEADVSTANACDGGKGEERL